jgi:hypothetical protein
MFGFEPEEIRQWLIYGAAALGGLVVLLVLLKSFGRKKKKGHKDLEQAQHERLADYPSPPPPGDKRLTIDGLDVRIRLVVFAPVGTEKRPVEVDEVPELLDDLIRGLGGFIASDKPRIRIWPHQLSVHGWPPTFYRLVQSPDEEHRKSQWIRVAGTIKIAGKPHLLGLALFADETNKTGTLTLEATDWIRRFHIEKT